MTGRVLPAVLMLLGLTFPAAAQTPGWPKERPPAPLAARSVKFPPYEIRTLANGLQVIAVSHHEQPAVSLRLIVRAGGAQDPETKPGLASLAASLLDQGTTTKSAEQVAQSIDSIGGALGVGAGADLTSVFAAVMKDSLDVGLDIIADVTRNPAFAPQEIERQRQQMISAMKVSYEDPDYIAGTVFDRLVYGFHPYGKPDSGTPESLASITRGDLAAFHTRWFGPNNAILAIVGDVTPEQAFAGAERAFGKWSRVEIPPTKAAEVPPPTRRVVVVDRPGAVQTEIRVGHIGLPRKHKDFLALDLALKILGGEGGNRLHRVLRSERGLTYGAEADVHALKDAGDIVASTDTRSDTTAEALRLIVDEISRLRRDRVHPRELGDAQAYLTGSFPLTIETPSAIALQVLNAVVYGLDLEELQTYRERVNSITPDDIQRVAQQYLYPDRLSIVLVGDANVFAKQLPAVGFDKVERIPLSQLDLASPDLRTPSRSGPGRDELAAAAPRLVPASFVRAGTTAQGDAARLLVDKAIEAKGGLALLRSIRTVKSASEMTFATPVGEARVKATAYVRYPGQFRIDAEGPDGLRIQTFDNGSAWVGDGRASEDAPAVVVRSMEAGVQRDIVALLLALAEKRVVGRRVADVSVGGTPMPALEVNLTSAGRVTLVFDPVTGLLASQRYGGDGGDLATEETFSDYRSVQGLQVAWRATLRREKNPPFQRLVRTFEINVPLEASFFKKPSTKL
ncbi:MAG TPA: pitrilysin family protein [Vicinamibacterales bacterium]|nr:pitrilysin family protein [Vicinamibacterales bacterium]